MKPRASWWWHLALAAAVPCVLLVVDVLLRRETLAAFAPIERRQYAVSVLGSFALWWGLGALASVGPRGGVLDRVRVAVVVGVGTLLFVVPFAVFATYQRFPNHAAFLFFANQARFVFRSAGTGDAWAPVLLVAGLALAVGGFVVLARRVAPSPRSAVLGVCALCVNVTTLGVSKLSDSLPLLADGSSVRFATLLARWGGSPPAFFEVVERLPPRLEQPPAPMAHNVLWVVHETLGAKYLRAPDGREVAPNMLALQRDPSVVWLERLHSVSSCTDVSVPALLSGVSPAAPLETQKLAWLPFDVAKRSGASTFVVASHRLQWAHMDTYLGWRQLDHFASAESFQPDCDDDSGVSDTLAYDDALRAMDTAAASGKRFMGLVRSNATHGPYQFDPADAPFVDDAGFGIGDTAGFVRYLNSVRFADRQFGAFWQKLAARPYFDDTLVVVLADHGEAFEQHGLRWHCGNFFPEESHVPGAVRLPKALRQGPVRDALDANRGEVLATTDAFPTVAGVLGWRGGLERQFSGASWLAPISPERRFVFTNCSDLRGCATADVGFYERGLRWVYAGQRKQWSAYDERTDPDAKVNVADSHQAQLQRALGELKAGSEGKIISRIVGP